jgi:hypothetical protein
MNPKKFISAVLAATMAFSILSVTASADFETEDGKTYYIVDGEKEKGFEKIDNDYYYFKQADGAMAKGWLKISGNWYYFSTKDGKMFAGKSYKIGGETYTFAADGKLAAYKAEGFLKGAWGDSNAELSEKIGESYLGDKGDGAVGGGVDYAPNWLKISSKSSAASNAMYYTIDDKFVMGIQFFDFYLPTAEIAETKDLLESIDYPDYYDYYYVFSESLTEKQISTIYKMKQNEAERKCGEAQPTQSFIYEAGEELFSHYKCTELTAFLSDNLIIYVAYTDDKVFYFELSIDVADEISDLSKAEIMENITQ